MLAVLTTHPIHYQVPLWRAIAASGRVPFEVWFLTDHGVRQRMDVGFGKEFSWDVPMLDGYAHRFLKVNDDWTVDQRRPWAIRLEESLGEAVRDRGVKAVWLQGWQVAAYWQAVRQVRGAGGKIWLRGESNDLAPRRGWAKELLKRQILGALFKRVDKFFVIGSANRRFYQRFGVTDGRMQPAPYCVDNARLAAEAAQLGVRRAELRRAWGIPEDAFCVLFCGKLIPKKRPLDLVAAARSMMQRQGNSKDRPLHLLFTGAGLLGPRVREACSPVFDAESPMASGGAICPGQPPASFVGFLNQTTIAQAYVAADCLVLPSDAGETWGLVVNEAMACSLPCIVSASCGCAEDLVKPVSPENVFPVGDINALTTALEKLRAGAGAPRAAWAVQAERHALERTVESVERAYAQLD